MLEALEQSMGIVTTACKVVGISRQTHYRWIDEDEDYAEKCNNLDTRKLKGDFIESKLLKLVDKEIPSAVIHASKTYNRERGYGERLEITGEDGRPILWEEIKTYDNEQEEERE